MQGFNRGDIVQLKSGGPKMTVSDIDGYGVTVKWFAGNKMESARVDPEALQAYVEPPK
jgi:uncharacterized protein YodC (DUF2158 family)